MRFFDDAIKRATRSLIALPYGGSDRIVSTQISTANYLISPDHSGNIPAGNIPAEDLPSNQTFHRNNGFWEAILCERLRYSMTVNLEDFFLFEWFPRSPGLYFTPKGQKARVIARDLIASEQEDLVIYNPYGKASMLDGGVGNIRLKPIKVDGQELMMMSASSSGICHEGVPVALPMPLYEKCIDEIAQRGAVVCSLVGKLAFVSKPLQQLYENYSEVPQLYLHVEELTPPTYPKNRRMEQLEVSVAVSFLGEFDGARNLYASYVSFNPAKKNSLRTSIEWLEQDYVAGQYKGQIITDFDEHRRHFDNATFSLKKVMKQKLQEAELSAIASDIFPNEEDNGTGKIHAILSVQTMIVNQTFNQEITMSQYFNSGNVAAMGDNAHAENTTQQIIVIGQENEEIDLLALVPLLSDLRAEAIKKASAPEDYKAIGDIKAAEEAAAKGDKPTVLASLKSAGNWTLGIAKELGASVVVKLIEHQLVPPLL